MGQSVNDTVFEWDDLFRGPEFAKKLERRAQLYNSFDRVVLYPHEMQDTVVSKTSRVNLLAGENMDPLLGLHVKPADPKVKRWFVRLPPGKSSCMLVGANPMYLNARILEGTHGSLYLGCATVDLIHAAVFWEAGHVKVMDLESAFGTKLMNNPLKTLKPEILKHNDEIKFGKCSSRVFLGYKADTPWLIPRPAPSVKPAVPTVSGTPAETIDGNGFGVVDTASPSLAMTSPRFPPPAPNKEPIVNERYRKELDSESEGDGSDGDVLTWNRISKMDSKWKTSNVPRSADVSASASKHASSALASSVPPASLSRSLPAREPPPPPPPPRTQRNIGHSEAGPSSTLASSGNGIDQGVVQAPNGDYYASDSEDEVQSDEDHVRHNPSKKQKIAPSSAVNTPEGTPSGTGKSNSEYNNESGDRNQARRLSSDYNNDGSGDLHREGSWKSHGQVKTCFNCGSPDHMARACQQGKSGRGGGRAGASYRKDGPFTVSEGAETNKRPTSTRNNGQADDPEKYVSIGVAEREHPDDRRVMDEGGWANAVRASSHSRENNNSYGTTAPSPPPPPPPPSHPYPLSYGAMNYNSNYSHSRGPAIRGGNSQGPRTGSAGHGRSGPRRDGKKGGRFQIPRTDIPVGFSAEEKGHAEDKELNDRPALRGTKDASTPAWKKKLEAKNVGNAEKQE